MTKGRKTMARKILKTTKKSKRGKNLNKNTTVNKVKLAREKWRTALQKAREIRQTMKSRITQLKKEYAIKLKQAQAKATAKAGVQALKQAEKKLLAKEKALQQAAERFEKKYQTKLLKKLKKQGKKRRRKTTNNHAPTLINKPKKSARRRSVKKRK